MQAPSRSCGNVPGERAAPVAVVLVNWNGAELCLDCLDTLLACDYPAFKVYVVDNDSSDDSVDRLRRWCEAPTRPSQAVDFANVQRVSARGGPVPHAVVDWRPGLAGHGRDGDPTVTLIRVGRNAGFAGGNNIGMCYAGPDHFEYFWLLNTDTVVDRRALDHLVECAQSDPGLGMVGSTLRYHGAPDTVQALGGARFDSRRCLFEHIGHGWPVDVAEQETQRARREMAYVVGASMLVSSRFVREVGPMQEDYFLYYEEVDWACRGMPAFRPGYAPRSHVYHKVGMSTAKSVPLFSMRLAYRNRIRFVARFMPDRLPAARRHLAWEMLRRLTKGEMRRASLIGQTLWDSHRLVAEARSTLPPRF